jgi:membrane protease YdiL (CAAX protease family)
MTVDVLLNDKPILKRVYYYSTGLIFAILLHGVFDFSILSQSDIVDTILIVMTASATVYFCYLNLNNLKRRIKD